MRHYYRITHFIFLIFSPCFLKAQQVIVTDAVSNSPISNTGIYNTQKTIVITTNINGNADISVFSINDTLFFEHDGYITRPYNTKVLQLYNYKVLLFPDALMEDQWIYVFSNFKEKRKDVPLKISLLSEKEISSSPTQSAINLLALSGDVAIQKNNQALGSAIINGFGSKYNTLVLDGIKLSSLLPVNISSLSQIELINYSTPVIHGNNAMGGIIYFKTAEPALAYGDSAKKISLNTSVGLATINQGLSANANLNIQLKNVAFLTGIGIGNYQSFKTGNNRSHGYSEWGKVNYYAATINGVDSVIANSDANNQAYTGYKKTDFVEKVILKINTTSDVTLYAQMSNLSNLNRSDLITSTENTPPLYSEWYDAPQQQLLSYIKFHSWKKRKIADELLITAAYQQNEQVKVMRIFDSNDRVSQNNNQQMYQLNLDMMKEISKANHVYYGLEWNYNQLLCSASIENISSNTSQSSIPEYPDGGVYSQNIAAYGNYIHYFNQAVSFTAGMRLAYYSINASTTDSVLKNIYGATFNKKNYALNGMAGVSYRASKANLFNYTFSTAYHIPDADDLLQFTIENNSVHIPNLNLLPTYIFKNEVGLKTALWENNILLYPALYFSYVINYTAETPITLASDWNKILNISRYSNIGNAFIYGASYQLSVKLGEYASFESSLYYTKGNLVTTNAPLPYISPIIGKTSIESRYKKYFYSFYILYNGWKKTTNYSEYNVENRTQATEDGIPAWATCNLSAKYELYKNIDILLVVENIFDKQYKTYNSVVSAPGRNISVTLRTAL